MPPAHAEFWFPHVPQNPWASLLRPLSPLGGGVSEEAPHREEGGQGQSTGQTAEQCALWGAGNPVPQEGPSGHGPHVLMGDMPGAVWKGVLGGPCRSPRASGCSEPFSRGGGSSSTLGGPVEVTGNQRRCRGHTQQRWVELEDPTQPPEARAESDMERAIGFPPPRCRRSGSWGAGPGRAALCQLILCPSPSPRRLGGGVAGDPGQPREPGAQHRHRRGRLLPPSLRGADARPRRLRERSVQGHLVVRQAHLQR